MFNSQNRAGKLCWRLTVCCASRGGLGVRGQEGSARGQWRHLHRRMEILVAHIAIPVQTGCLWGEQKRMLGKEWQPQKPWWVWHWGARDAGLYLEVNAPGQRMALPIPQAELPVVATGEEAVLEGMRAEPPELIRVALQQSMGCHLGPASVALPTLLPGALAPEPELQGRSPGPDLPSAMHSSWFPPAAQSPAPPQWPAQPRSVQESVEWWRKVRGPLAIPLPPPLPQAQPSPHLSLLEGHQSWPPLDQPAVPSATTQHSPVPPETQSKDGPFVSVGLGHNPVGLCWQSHEWVTP